MPRLWSALLFAMLMSLAGSSAAAWLAPERPDAHPAGALTGASIFLSPGHGWWHNGTKWTTQRGLSHGLIEDHSNAETVIQYLVPYLENAGANVCMARERDMQTNMVILEQEEDGVFVPDIPESGYYTVSVWYNRTSVDGSITVAHTGGTTAWRQRLDHDFGTWKYIGRYWFEKGASAETGSVTVSHPDAVQKIRFGGGMGVFDVDGSTSGKPRWEESGLYHTQFLGFDPKVTGPGKRWNQVHAMPRWAEWEMETWEGGRSIYMSWHTNGSYDHTMTGISTYIYSVWGWGPPDFFHGFPGSRELAEHVHFEVLNDVRAGWDPEWDDVGIVGRWLGETNPQSNGVMPSFLMENGFHDNPYDASQILEPEFRRLAAKSAYQGIVKYYFHEVGFSCMVMAPETPTHLRVTGTNGGSATVAWNAPPSDEGGGLLGDPAAGYRVFLSRNGKGFDNGTVVVGETFTMADLEPGEMRYVRVTSVNEGGESWPSETLCVRMPEGVAPRVLIVNGFDRLDRGLNFIGPNGSERGILDKMNSRDYCIQHVDALDGTEYALESASNEAVIAGDVTLGDYAAVIWMLGREAEDDRTFDEIEQRLVREYVVDGGGLVVSGAHVASDLSRTAEGTLFLRDVLGARLVTDDAGEQTVWIPLPGTNLGSPTHLSDKESGPYELRESDVIVPDSGSETVLVWEDRRSSAAAVVSSGDRDVLYFAFPLETMLDAGVRRALVTEFLEKTLTK